MIYEHITDKEATNRIDNLIDSPIDVLKAVQIFLWGLGYNNIVNSLERVIKKNEQEVVNE